MDVFIVNLAAEPSKVFAYVVVEFEAGPFHFGICVFEPQNEFSVIRPGVFVAEQNSSSRAEVQNTVRVGRKTRYNLFVFIRVRQGRQVFFFGFLFLLGFRPFLCNDAFLLFEAETINLCQDFVNQGGELFDLRAELRFLA